MNILFPIPKFYPHSGGGPSFTVYWLAKALAEKGHHVTVVTSNKGLNNIYPANCWNDVDGIKVMYCTYWNLKFPVRMTLSSLREVKNNDIVQLSSACSPTSLFVALLALCYNKKIIWSPRGEFSESFVGGNKLKNLYFKFLRLLFNKKVLFHSTSEKEALEIRQVMGECQIVTIPNYMEMPQKLNCNVEKTLLYVGRINPIKALDKLIDALYNSTVFKKTDYVLKIAGDTNDPGIADYLKSLKEQISSRGLADRVLFLGVAGDNDKFALYSKAYFSFLVSESENFGNVVIEALSQGTPVVTSLGTPWKLLPEHGIGYHVSNDPMVLARVIDEILQMPEDAYREMRTRVFNACTDMFSIKKNVDKWINLYSGLLK